MEIGSNRPLRFGDYEVDPESGKLMRNGWPVKIQPQPMRVLGVLLEQPGETVSREVFRARIWGDRTFVEFDQGLNYCIRQIRLALHDQASTPRYIEAVPKQGYRFIAQLAGSGSEDSARCESSHEQALVASSAGDSLSGHPPKRFAASRLTLLLSGAAVLAAFAVAWVSYQSSLKTTGRPLVRSVAVLPLENLSGDPSQDYLADGMTEELIGRLAGIHDLRVISRTSVMRFKDTKLSVPEIAQTLRVDAIVEGSVMRQGDRIRVHAQLIRGAADEHFWSETYDRQMADVLSLESEVAQHIAEKVEVTVTGQEHSRLRAARHVSPEVYESYLKGEFGTHNTQAELEESITYLEEAIRKDPTFAPAYIGLANRYKDLSTIFVGAKPGEMRPKVISAAQKALEMDPQLAEAHVLLADVYQKRWQWTDAEGEYKRALQLQPNNPAAHLGFASWLLCQGRVEEALAWARRARELDPLGTAGVDIGWILFNARHYDQAIRELRSVLAVHPDSASAQFYLAFALIGKGQPEQAILELERTVSMMHRSPGSLELLATAYGRAGHRAQALRIINELKKRQETSYFPSGALVNPYLGINEYNEALSWLERAYTEQSNILQFLKVHPFFDPLRGNPRFEDLVHRVGLK